MSGNVSLYFHIPFCTKKCPYCHFFVLPNKEQYKTPFITALRQEWALRAPQLQGKQVVSIYFGGGTPTKLPPATYALLLQEIRPFIAPHCEITLEANPEDVTLPLMQEFQQIGINRVSLGVQSLVPSELTLLGRTHNPSKARAAIEATYEAGITNISIDLLFELPSQTLDTFHASLRAVKDLPITHLSLYNLTFEPHTVFFKQQHALTPLLPPDPDKLQMLQDAVHILDSYGLHRYEISAFCKPGYASLHNSGYWTARPFLGLGPSAFSYWNHSRFSNTTHFADYVDLLGKGEIPVGFHETLPHQDRFRELFAVQLRLLQGVDLTLFTEKNGPLPDVFQHTLERLITRGWLESQDTHVRLTEEGRLFYDSVAVELI